MDAIRHTVRIPSSREIRIQLPETVRVNDKADVIVLLRSRSKAAQSKIKLMAQAAKDEAFQEDVRQVCQDFESVDSEGW